MLHEFLIGHLFDSSAEQETLRSPRLPFTLRNFHKLSNLRKNGLFGKNYHHPRFVSARREHLLQLAKKIIALNQVLLLRILHVKESHHTLSQIILGFLVIQTKLVSRLSHIAKIPSRFSNLHLNQKTQLKSRLHSIDSSGDGLVTTSKWTACIQIPLQR